MQAPIHRSVRHLRSYRVADRAIESLRSSEGPSPAGPDQDPRDFVNTAINEKLAGAHTCGGEIADQTSASKRARKRKQGPSS